MSSGISIRQQKTLINSLASIVKWLGGLGIGLITINIIIAGIILVKKKPTIVKGDAVVLVAATSMTGTGFLISSEGYILTAAHILKDDNVATIIFRDGNFQDVNLLFKDEAADIALLQIPPTNNLPKKLILGNSETLNQSVVLVGYPSGAFAETRGLITERNTDYLRTNISLNPGNGGGPLVNEEDRSIIGMIISANNINQDTVNNVHYAIPINKIKNICEQNGFLLQ